MLKKAILLIAIALSLPIDAHSASLSQPTAYVKDSAIYSSAVLTLEESEMNEIKNGVSKEIVFYFDLFREWSSWPDEFILGKSFVRTLYCDPVRLEYIATSLHQKKLQEKRFGTCDELISWAQTVPDFRLTAISELEDARYMVSVTAESRLRRLPPFIGLLLFFVKEKEFSIYSETPYFGLGTDNR